MQYVINSIINIDKEAGKFDKNIEEMIEAKNKELKEQLKKAEEENVNIINTIKKNIVNEGIYQAEKKAEEVSKRKEMEVDRINSNYINAKDAIINTVFLNIINS